MKINIKIVIFSFCNNILIKSSKKKSYQIMNYQKLILKLNRRINLLVNNRIKYMNKIKKQLCFINKIKTNNRFYNYSWSELNNWKTINKEAIFY